MIRTSEEYLDSIRDGREVWIDGERVDDVTTHPAFKPIVDARAASTTWPMSPPRPRSCPTSTRTRGSAMRSG